MNDDFITEIFDETGSNNDISVSYNDAEPVEKIITQDEMESETTVEENIETVSGNDVPASDSVAGVGSVSGNNIYIPYDDSGLVAQVGTMTAEISVLNNSVLELHTTVVSISALLTMLLGFTVFKWCEQKIKRFSKGLVNKNE